jgi:hypothetical protein
MATGTAATVARKYHSDQVHYLTKLISYADGASNVYTIGVIPAGALILKPASGVHVTTVYNSGTNNLLNIGTSADDDLFGTVLSLTAANFVPLDESIGGFYVTSDTTITASHALTGTAATTGAGVVVIAYVMANRSL